jgi:hypothetical protein
MLTDASAHLLVTGLGCCNIDPRRREGFDERFGMPALA